MTLFVRRAAPDDWVDWRQVRQRSLVEDPQAFASSVTMWTGEQDTEARWRERLADGPCFLADADGVPVGMVAGRVEGAHAELISMWVAPEVRSRGVGAALIAAVLQWSGERPVTLRVMDGNRAAIRAYESRGFVLDDLPADSEGCRRMDRPAAGSPS